MMKIVGHDQRPPASQTQSPLSGRPDWRPEKGLPGDDLALLQAQALGMMALASSLVLEGVFAAFPTLKIVLIESGTPGSRRWAGGSTSLDRHWAPAPRGSAAGDAPTQARRQQILDGNAKAVYRLDETRAAVL
jgi:predicted TIM-barrel fold metal-dependent hydrolase